MTPLIKIEKTVTHKDQEIEVKGEVYPDSIFKHGNPKMFSQIKVSDKKTGIKIGDIILFDEIMSEEEITDIVNKMADNIEKYLYDSSE